MLSRMGFFLVPSFHHRPDRFLSCPGIQALSSCFCHLRKTKRIDPLIFFFIDFICFIIFLIKSSSKKRTGWQAFLNKKNCTNMKRWTHPIWMKKSIIHGQLELKFDPKILFIYFISIYIYIFHMYRQISVRREAELSSVFKRE